MATTAERTRRVIAEQFPSGSVTDDANFVSDLGGDSLDVVELKLLLELEFDQPIDGYLDDLPTVGAVVKFMEEHIDD